MERITKKRPPNNTTIQMIFTGYENSSPRDYVSPVFKDLLPYPEQGRIYIGFPTHQTTGCCSHLAARVIPTVCMYFIKLINIINIYMYIFLIKFIMLGRARVN